MITKLRIYSGKHTSPLLRVNSDRPSQGWIQDFGKGSG